MIFRAIALLCLAAVPAAAGPQAPVTKPASHGNGDFSGEPFVIEAYATSVRFENDGTGAEDLRVRVRIQSDAGIEQWSKLAIDYNMARETVEIRDVRIHRTDGSTIHADVNTAADSSGPLSSGFSDYRDSTTRQMTVPSLAAGDTLEYEIVKRTIMPAAPDQFWFQHRFVNSAVVLNEELTLDLPAERKVILKSPGVLPHETEQNGRAIYRWKHDNLKRADASGTRQQAAARSKPPDVQLTSFAAWTEVAQWYAKLARGQAEPTPEIRAKVQDLTADRENEIDKIQAIYEYVSKNIRYSNSPFGAVGYRPRTAGEILATRYGDSNDQHTLLTGMLRAAQIPSEAVLIHSTQKFDALVPSPAQFDRVITVAVVGKDSVWMDPNDGVVPFRLLAAGLRKKSALMISADGSERIAETPADPQFLSTQTVSIDGSVSEIGKLTAHAHYSVRGDTELALRSTFHRAAPADWNEIGRTILTLDGIHGEVSSVKPGDPTAIHDPFEIDIEFSQVNFINWSSRRSAAPLPLLAIGLPDLPEDKTKPVDLGSPLNVSVQSRLTLPATFAARMPASLALARDFAEFKSAYEFADHTVTAQRKLDFKMRTLPSDRAAEYAAFSRAVTGDQTRPLVIENNAPAPPTVPASATADDLFDTGSALLNSREFESAIPLLERAAELDPQHKEAWDTLGVAYQDVGETDKAIADFKKQIEVDPSDAFANVHLGIAFESKADFADAEIALRKQIEAHPLDAVTHAFLGEMLLQQERDYARAIPDLEKAVILAPKNWQYQVYLGDAYAHTGRMADAGNAFEKALSMSAQRTVRWEIAFSMADANMDLAKAQSYAESAVSSAESDLRGIDLKKLTSKELVAVQEIGDYWDALGWVYFRQGNLKAAERYIQSAWLLNERSETGDRLAQVYEKLGEKDRAIHACALSLAAHSSSDTRARLILLLGSNAQIDDLVAKAKQELAALTVMPVGKLLNEDAQADFLIVLAPAEKKARVEAVQFLMGDEWLRPFGDQLRSLDYGAVFPGPSTAEIIRSGVLACYAKREECTFTLIPPDEAHTKN